jgi:hypothetical protein
MGIKNAHDIFTVSIPSAAFCEGCDFTLSFSIEENTNVFPGRW